MKTERGLAWLFIDQFPDDAARLLEGLPPGEVAIVQRDAPVRLAARLFLKMAPSTGAACLAELEPDRAAEVLEELPPRTAASLMRPLAAEVRERFLEALPPEAARTIGALFRFSEETAGALMDPGALALSRDSTVSQGRELVRRQAKQALYYVYVVDDERRLTGVVTMRELLLSAPGASIASVMRTDIVSLPAHADRMAILAHPGWRQFHALPVIDQGGALLGVLRYETLRRLEEDAAAARSTRGLQRTALELGEIYWLSIGRLMASLGGAGGERSMRRDATGADDDT